MIGQITLTGIVLTSMPVGDYDKRLVLLTKERGKIAAFAKGVRKQNSILLGCTQTFVFGEFLLYEGRNSYNLISAVISNYFGDLRNDLESVSYAMYFCEFSEYLTRENLEATSELKLLYQSMRALEKKTIPYRLIRAVFELKLITENGEAPQVFACVKCGSSHAIDFFSVSLGGLVCRNCSLSAENKIQLEDSTVYTMQYIISSTIEKLYTFTVSDQVLKELVCCMEQYIKHYVGKKFNTLEMLKIL